MSNKCIIDYLDMSESESVHFTSAQEETDAIDWNVSIPETFPLPETQIFNQSTPNKGI